MLQKIRADTLEAIQLAASAGDSQKVLSESTRLTQVEVLIQEQEALDRQVQGLQSKDHNSSSLVPVREEPPFKRKIVTGISPRAQGAKRRTQFVNSCASQGIKLTHIKGALFKNAKLEQIGIASASERKENGWFLGLPSGSLNHAVLLCENKLGRVIAVCLSKNFLQKYGRHLSVSKNQTKFNVVLRHNNYFLSVPGIGAVPVDDYIDRPALIG